MLQWVVSFAIHTPLPLQRSGSGKPLVQQCKLELLVGLAQAGWRPGEHLSKWGNGEARLYDHSLARPKSYFAALLSVDDIIAKGVQFIEHFEKDGYYKCLIHQSPSDLQETLAQMGSEIRSNAWFVDRSGGDAILDDDAGLQVVPAYEAIPDEHVLSPLLPLPPAPGDCATWKRCVVTSPGGLQLKVYFDNGSHSSGRYRGWTDCPFHSCIRYRFCDEHGSREALAADMVAWAEVGCQDAFGSHEKHIRYRPAVSRVRELTAVVSLQDF